MSLRSDYAYGVEGFEGVGGVMVPENATVEFELELLDWNTLSDRCVCVCVCMSVCVCVCACVYVCI